VHINNKKLNKDRKITINLPFRHYKKIVKILKLKLTKPKKIKGISNKIYFKYIKKYNR
jgi:hypothetical protein